MADPMLVQGASYPLIHVGLPRKCETWWPAIESNKDTKRTQSVEWGSSRSCQAIEKMVSAEGIESITKRSFNDMQGHG
jgi:hypothetical protein